MRPATVTQTGAGTSAVIALDADLNITDISLSTKVTGTVAYTIEYTFDDIFSATYTPAGGTWYPSNAANMVAATANQFAKVDQPITGCRINQASGSGSVILRANQALKG